MLEDYVLTFWTKLIILQSRKISLVNVLIMHAIIFNCLRLVSPQLKSHDGLIEGLIGKSVEANLEGFPSNKRLQLLLFVLTN